MRSASRAPRGPAASGATILIRAACLSPTAHTSTGHSSAGLAGASAVGSTSAGTSRAARSERTAGARAPSSCSARAPCLRSAGCLIAARADSSAGPAIARRRGGICRGAARDEEHGHEKLADMNHSIGRSASHGFRGFYGAAQDIVMNP